jgi:hypothetical protein
MHASYQDIMSRIGEAPTWWDENGTPRWGYFEPDACANIYADQAALAEIACQCCGSRFKVAFSWSRLQRMQDGRRSIIEAITTRTLEYGDPPNVGCCMSGATMNSETLRVIEFHARHEAEFATSGTVTDPEKYFSWRRDKNLEVNLGEASCDDPAAASPPDEKPIRASTTKPDAGDRAAEQNAAEADDTETWTVSITVRVHDKQKLEQAAEARAIEDGWSEARWRESSPDAGENLRMLLDPGESPPGCEIQDSCVERETTLTRNEKA